MSTTRGPAGPTTGAGPAPPAAVPAARRRGMGSAGDMLRSLVVVGGMVAVVVLLFFHPTSTQVRSVDVAGPTSDARSAGLPVAVPHLRRGWTPSSARFAPDTTEGLPSWHLGYLTPSGADAEVDVTRGATPAWVDGVLGDSSGLSDDDPSRVQVIAGQRWNVRTVEVDGSAIRGLVRTSGAVTTVVSGHASSKDLRTLAAAVG